MTSTNAHEENPLSQEETSILAAFGNLGVRAEESVPSDVIFARATRSAGFLPGSEPWRWESAFISLQVRGFVEPGADPFSAISWQLTPEGHAFVHASRGKGL
jgi:hypothetical protein